VIQVLETLNNKQLITKLNNCEFGKDSLIYLGKMIDRGELRVDLDKIVVINQCATPTNLT
jgi:hypothetical protein